MGSCLSLEQLGDINVFSPLLLILFTLQALHFYQLSHFNFTKLRLLSHASYYTHNSSYWQREILDDGVGGLDMKTIIQILQWQ